MRPRRPPWTALCAAHRLHWIPTRMRPGVLVVASLVLLGPVCSVRAGQNGSVATIAAVLIDFVHTCTPMQRRILQAIAADRGATDPERTLAAALLRVHHRPRAKDVLLLQA